jgi:beta-catenin-like protein 1
MTKRRGDGADDDNNDEDAPFFIASATWQGVRSGYYFGTTVERGTGYYLDSFASSVDATAVAGGVGDTKAVPPAAAAAADGRKKKKRVRIDESANTETTTTTQLLDDAERRAVGRKIVTLTPAGVVQAGVSLRRAMDQNALLRAKAASGGGAETYMDSEVALYEQIAALKAIAADPANLYGVLLNDDTAGQNGTALSSTTTILDDLMQLLLHENTDIAVAVTSVLLEWLDVDLLVLDNDESAPTLVVLDLATTLLSRRYNLADLLVDHLYRTTTVITTNSSSGGDDEEDNDDEVGRGTEDILAVLENLLEMEQQQQQQQEDGSRHLLATAVILCRDTKLIPWLFETASARSVGILSDITSREEAHKIISNWGAIPTTSATGNNSNKKTTTLDGIEILLQIVARFRKTQPRDAVEVELLENTATAMAGILNYGGPASIQAFLDAQGVELVLRCVKEKVYAGYVTLKWLDFSGGGGNNANHPVYRLACERAVDAGLFKYVFALFQGKACPNHYNTNNTNGASNGTTAVQQKKERKAMNQTIQNTIIRILYALTCHLKPNDEQERRERLVAKFTDKKITQRLVDLLLDYDQRVRIAEYNFFKSDLAEEEEGDDLDENMVQLAALEAKLAAGGDTLHRLAAIAAFCGAASKSIHSSILASLQAKESGVSLIREALLEFLSVLDETSSFKAQLRTLVQVLV